MANLKISSISNQQVIQFLKMYKECVALLLVGILLLFYRSSRNSSTEEVNAQISSLLVKVNVLQRQLKDSKNISSDLTNYQTKIKDFINHCFIFKNSISVYKFSMQFEQLANKAGEKASATIRNTYNITKNKTISLSQDFSEFNGDYLVIDYNISVQTSFAKIVQLLQEASDLEYFVNVKKLDLKSVTKSSKNDQNADTNQEHQVQANISFAILGKIEV